MALRPKEDRMIRFRQIGTTEEKEGKVIRILKPEFNRHLKRVQYVVECAGEKVYLESEEILSYVK